MIERSGHPRPLGTDRSDDPLIALDLDIRIVDAIKLISYTWATNIGTQDSPIGRAMIERINEPHVGDLVLVADTARLGPYGIKSEESRRMGWGYFLGQFREPIYTDARWADVTDAEDGISLAQQYGGVMPMERVFYIQYGPSPEDVCRWGNASLMGVPYSSPDGREFREQIHAACKPYLNGATR